MTNSTTDARISPSMLALDVYRQIYPYVKEKTREYKLNHDYSSRKQHALTIYVAGYFLKLQESKSSGLGFFFNIKDFYRGAA